jgi:hypothetical protein
MDRRVQVERYAAVCISKAGGIVDFIIAAHSGVVDQYVDIGGAGSGDGGFNPAVRGKIASDHDKTIGLCSINPFGRPSCNNYRRTLIAQLLREAKANSIGSAGNHYGLAAHLHLLSPFW